jgi:hypothetical protein
MSNQEHTPGPWKVKWDKNSVYVAADGTDRNLNICRVMQHRNVNNTSLILHAPDLLEMCERLHLFASAYGHPVALESAHGLMENAKKLVKQAKGE